ncbi:MAG: hydroxymethylglutaryl-CoA lyase [Actinomycetes bacterium]
MSVEPQVLLRDVSLRDGLQDEAPIPTAAKLAIYGQLVQAGIRELELTSFVRPDRVPAMADAEAMAAATADSEVDPRGPVRWGLVLNLRGAQRALAAGLRHLQYVVSVSEEHNLANAGRSVDASLAALGQITELAARSDATVEVTLSTSFGCPYAGPVGMGQVIDVAEKALSVGVGALSLADTIGTAVPTEVTAMVGSARRISGGIPVAVHLHDTRGLGVANALAAIDAGADRVDGTVGGLGGCPFAPGASGNMAIEDLAHALDAMGVPTGIDLDELLVAARMACEAVGRPVQSHVGVAGPRFARLAVR